MYHIRQAGIADVDTIKHLAQQTWWPTYGDILSPEQINYMLDELYSTEKLSSQISTGEQTFLLLTETGDKPVAFAAYSPRPENPLVYKLHKLYCLPQAQGKGYGKVLINEVCKRALAAGKHSLHLNVNRFNKAKVFYEKLGFNVIAQEDIPIGNYQMNDYVMELRF